MFEIDSTDVDRNHIRDGIFMDTYPLADLKSFTGSVKEVNTGARRVGQIG